MTHDPLCPELWRYEDGQPCMFCALITRVREDDLHRLMRDDDYAYVATQSYAAALRDAVPLLKGILLEVEQHMDRTDYRIYKEYRKEVFVRFQAAIEALKGER